MPRTFEEDPKNYPCGPYVPTKRGDFLDPKCSDILFLSAGDIVLSGDDGTISYTSYVDSSVNTTYDIELVGTDITLSGSDGSTDTVNLSSFIDDTTVTYDISLSGINIQLSGSDSTIQWVDLTTLLNDVDTQYTQNLVGDVLSLSGSDGSIVETNLSGYLDDTNTTYTLSSDGGDVVLLGSDGTTSLADLPSSNLTIQTITTDIVLNQSTVTVSGYDPLTQVPLYVRIDDNIVPSTDGVTYSGRVDGNVFKLTGSPNATYIDAFVITVSNL